MALISTIYSQPTTNDIKVGYRPIILTPTLPNTMPIVFCDIYFNDTFYKSLSVTTPGLYPDFDIQDAAQEYLSSYIAPSGGSITYPASSIFAKVYCKFRGSTLVDNLTVIEQTIPIQGTNENLPVPGTGLESNTFYIINSTLQHEDNQNLLTHLNSYKQGVWAATVYPLSHRNNNYKVNKSDYLPILHPDDNIPDCIRIDYTKKDGTTGTSNTCGIFDSCPNLVNLAINFSDNGDGTQKFTFTWDTPDPLLNSIDIQWSIANANIWNIGNIRSIPSPQTIDLPLGLYDFRFKIYGDCNAFTTSISEDEGIASPACVAATFSSSTTLPDATVNTAYNFDITLAGTSPFSLVINNKPAWMSITLGTAIIRFRGTPLFADIATNVSVSISVDNACTPGTLDLNELIDINTIVVTANSSIFSNDLIGPNRTTLIKSNLPSYIILPHTNIYPSTPVPFFAPNEAGADYNLNFASTTILTQAILVTNGNTYYGVIDNNFVEWNGINVINGMQIELFI